MKKVLALTLAVVMTFTNSILAGETLVRDSIKSEGFVTGVNGWSINRDGTAEFNNVISRGEVVIGDYPNGEHAIGGGVDAPNGWAFYSSNPEETSPAQLQAIDQVTQGTLIARSPDLGGSLATLSLSMLTAAFGNESTAQLTANEIILGTYGAAGDVIRVNQTVTRTAQAWTDIPLVNSWVDLAGARADYMLDPVGRVQLRGQIVSGVAATVATLPAGFRPTQTMEWIMRAVGGVTMCAVTVSTAGVITVTANLATAQASGIRLDSISFPTF